jgi:cyclohexanecarboxylate-CoA ligase
MMPLLGYEAASEEHSISTAVKRAAQTDPDRVAVYANGRPTSYRDFDRHIDRTANWLSTRGVERGMLVSFWVPAGLAASVIFVAVHRVGAIAHPMSANIGPSEARSMFAQISPAAVLVGSDESPGRQTIELLHEMCPTAVVAEIADLELDATGIDSIGPEGRQQFDVADGPDRPSVLVFTSGTTGVPKGIMHSARSIGSVATDLIERLAITPADVVGVASPIGHVRWVLYGGLIPFLARASLFVTNGWRAGQWVDAANEVACTFAIFSPKHLDDLRSEAAGGNRVRRLRRVMCGGSYLSPRLLSAAERELGVTVVRGYGSTEFPNAVAGRFDDIAANRLHFDGSPLGDTEVSLTDGSAGQSIALYDGATLGRIRIRGAHGALGRLGVGGQLEPVVDPDGWLVTEDYGEFVDDRLRVTGRAADLIIRNGENINANELESILREHPSVVDVAVVGQRDEVVGERVCAIVVADAAAPTLTVELLATFLQECGVTKRKWPEAIISTDAITRTPGGKIRRTELWAMANDPMVSLSDRKLER